MSAPALLFALAFLFLAGLAFAPGVDLGERVRNAARFAVLTLALGWVAWSIWIQLVMVSG